VPIFAYSTITHVGKACESATGGTAIIGESSMSWDFSSNHRC